MSRAWAYYNEIDPQAAAWLRELIKQGHIANGEVDERSIEDVRPDDLAGFRQCHFFAGIGGWSLALRLAGWSDEREIWTGSCPCQPFSAAGKGDGFADERHLWPAFQWLIQQRRPAVVAGEQVASHHANAWIDLVSTDLEALGYRVGAIPFPAAGVGAPHIRDRLYWLADTNKPGLEGRSQSGSQCPVEFASGAGRMAGRLADACGDGREVEIFNNGRRKQEASQREANVTGGMGALHSPGKINGHWRDADWLGCRDGSWRPAEPGTFPLAHGVHAAMGRLRGYGNAIVPQAAEAFIRAYCDARGLGLIGA